MEVDVIQKISYIWSNKHGSELWILFYNLFTIMMQILCVSNELCQNNYYQFDYYFLVHNFLFYKSMFLIVDEIMPNDSYLDLFLPTNHFDLLWLLQIYVTFDLANAVYNQKFNLIICWICIFIDINKYILNFSQLI